MFENVDVRRTADACLYHKLTSEPKGSGELKSSLIRVHTVCHYVCNFLEALLMVKPPCFYFLDNNFWGVSSFQIFKVS